MPKREKSAVTGERGHLSVLIELLDTGGAINSLSFSDYGIDLHMLPPQRDHDPSDGSITEWDVTSYPVHFQVKSTAAGKSAVVTYGQLHGWVIAGSPTFLANWRNGTISYADPLALARTLAVFEQRNGTDVDIDALVTVPQQRFDRLNAVELLERAWFFWSVPVSGTPQTCLDLIDDSNREMHMAQALMAMEGRLSHAFVEDLVVEVRELRGQPASVGYDGDEDLEVGSYAHSWMKNGHPTMNEQAVAVQAVLLRHAALSGRPADKSSVRSLLGMLQAHAQRRSVAK